MTVLTTLAAFAAVAIVAPLAAAQAILPPGVFRLNNHADGGAADPRYGLRLDELKDVTGGHDVFTFDFDHELSEMLLEYDGASITISGRAFGGRDVGSSYEDSPMTGVYGISFTYDTGVGLATPDNDILVSGVAMGANTGSITTPLGEVIGLWDKPKGDTFAFRLGDMDDDEGHRGFAGVSGWGWLNHADPDTHVAASDWLFTVDPTPVPAPASLLLAGVGGLLLTPRSRRN